MAVAFVQRQAGIIRAAVVFAGAALLFFWAFNTAWVIEHVLNPFTTATAEVSAWLFRLTGQSAAVYGQTVRVNDTVVTIGTGCNGAEAFALYCAAVLALPAHGRMRLLGLGLGVTGIFVINQVRILGLILVAILRPEFLFEAHNYVGQTFVIVMGMALWVFWAERYGHIRNAPAG
ncbi:MAG: hypothetical protein Kow0074_17440 [Candidatus Zixiibacteriota bacterium]